MNQYIKGSNHHLEKKYFNDVSAYCTKGFENSYLNLWSYCLKTCWNHVIFNFPLNCYWHSAWRKGSCQKNLYYFIKFCIFLRRKRRSRQGSPHHDQEVALGVEEGLAAGHLQEGKRGHLLAEKREAVKNPVQKLSPLQQQHQHQHEKKQRQRQCLDPQEGWKEPQRLWQ